MNSLWYPAGAWEGHLRAAIVAVGKIAYDRGLITSNDGNLSLRFGPDRILMTPAGANKGRLSPSQMVVLDLAGMLVHAGEGGEGAASSEAPMHLEAYRLRPDVRAVIHAHPPYCIALTVSDIPLRADVLPEVLATLGEVPTTDFAMPSSDEGARVVRDWLRDHKVILLRQHGALAVGADLEEALTHMERVEHAARVIAVSTLLGKVNTIPEAARRRLMEAYASARPRMSDA